MSYFLDSGPTFTGLISLVAEGIVLDHVSFRFWISCLFLEIFTIKVGSCVKLRQILHVFWPQNCLEEGPRFLDLHYKIDANTDHVTKFGRSAEGAWRYYGELKNKKTSRVEGLLELPFWAA